MGPAKSVPESESLTGYRFADITLDPVRRTVSRGGTEVKLGKLTYELLLLLVDAAPRVVTQDEVAERLWNDRHVTQDTVRQRVKLLRKALSDDAEVPRYFTVIRGQGYRLIPDVEIVAAESPPIWRRRRRLAASIALIAVAALSVFFWRVPGIQDEGDIPVNLARSIPHERSIAVLPFESLVPDSDSTNFVGGIHNDLLTQLSKVSSLKIISRTSVLGYRDRNENLRHIGDELNVATILEGSVQRSGDSVRINVQLIDAASDEHLWAESFDRELTAQNLFAIQSEIAKAIADSLQAVISPEELARLQEVPTENTRAYNHYLIGNKHLRGIDNRTVFSEAAKAFERAVKADPEFALAWALLSRAHSAVYYFVDKTEARRELARQAIDRAIELDPDLPEAHYAMGFYQYHCLDDTEAALSEWNVAAQGMQGDSRLYLARSYVYRRTGGFDQSIRNQNMAIELDPRNIEQLLIQWHTYSLLRDYQQAEQFADRIIEISPDRPIGYFLKSYLPIWREGNFDAAKTTLDNAPVFVPSYWFRWAAAIYERDYDTALGVLDGWRIDVDDRQGSYTPKASYYGMTHQLARMPDLATEQYQASRAMVERELQKNPKDPRLHIALGESQAALDQPLLATTSAKKATKLMPRSLDATAGPATHLSAILILIAAGDHDSAIKELDAYLASPGVWSIEGLLPDPRLDSIRDDPQFTALVAKYGRKPG